MINSYVIGTTEVVANLDRTGRNITAEMGVSIGRLAVKLQRMVQQDKLSGQVLNVRTGRLRRSIAQTVVEEGDKVVGIVSTPVVYAPYHEYGYEGTEQVREYLRKARAGFSPKKGATSGAITVRAHSRKVSYPARSFLRTALRDLDTSGDIRTEMEAAIKRAIG